MERYFYNLPLIETISSGAEYDIGTGQLTGI